MASGGDGGDVAGFVGLPCAVADEVGAGVVEVLAVELESDGPFAAVAHV